MSIIRGIGALALAIALQFGVLWFLTWLVSVTYEWNPVGIVFFWISIGGLLVIGLPAMPVSLASTLTDSKVALWIIAGLLVVWRISLIIDLPSDLPSWVYGGLMAIHIIGLLAVAMSALMATGSER